MTIEQAVDEFLAGDRSNYIAIWKQLAMELKVDENNAIVQAGRVVKALGSHNLPQDIIPIVGCFGSAFVRRRLMPSFCSTLSDEEVAERIEGYRREFDAG